MNTHKRFSFFSSSPANGHNNERSAPMRYLLSTAILMVILGAPVVGSASSNAGQYSNLLSSTVITAHNLSASSEAKFTSAKSKADCDKARASAYKACGANPNLSSTDVKACENHADSLWNKCKTRVGTKTYWCCEHWTSHTEKPDHKSCPAGQHCDKKAKGCVDEESEEPEEQLTGPVCGNDTVEDGETCDDGNTEDGDWCSADCTAKTWPTWLKVLLAIIGFIIGAGLLWLLILLGRKRAKKDGGGKPDGDVACASDGCDGKGKPETFCAKCGKKLPAAPTPVAVAQTAGGPAEVTEDLVSQLEEVFVSKEGLQRDMAKAQADAAVEAADRQLSLNSDIATALEGSDGDPRETLLAVFKTANEGLKGERDKASALSASLDSEDDEGWR